MSQYLEEDCLLLSNRSFEGFLNDEKQKNKNNKNLLKLHKNFTNIYYLSLKNNQFTNTYSFNHFKNLSQLILSHNKISKNK